jgi:calcium-dependent protein kinase
MVHRYINTKEAYNIKIIFNALDSEKDSEIEGKEFRYNLKALFGLTLIDKEFKKIIQNADMNKDGNIQYTEFMMAGCNKHDLLTDSSMRTTFSNMDYDKDGKISKADYDFLIRGFAADLSVPFEDTEHGKDW